MFGHWLGLCLYRPDIDASEREKKRENERFFFGNRKKKENDADIVGQSVVRYVV